MTLTTPPWNTWIHHSDFGTEPRIARGPNPAGPGPFLRPFCPKRPAKTTLSPFPTPSPPRTVVQAPPRGYRDPTRRADTLGLTKPATGRATPRTVTHGSGPPTTVSVRKADGEEKPRQALEGQTPAERAGLKVVSGDKWLGLLKASLTTPKGTAS